MSEYQFTKDWFGWAPPVWEQLVPMLPERDPEVGRTFLEIGSFEGRSAVWVMEHMMQDDDYLFCVDTWEGGEEHGAEDMGFVWKRFCHNMEVASERFPDRHYGSLMDTSYKALSAMTDRRFDFVYIDGSHVAKDVLTDACMVWPLIKKGGIVVFDDYLWGDARDVLHRPKLAIDAFTNIFAEEVEIVHVGYQLAVRKKR